jgi:hypothetical protein
VPLWKLDDQISAALAQRDLKTAWPDSKRSELAKQLANDRQLHDLHTFSSFNNKDGDNDDDDDNDDDEDTRGTLSTTSSLYLLWLQHPCSTAAMRGGVTQTQSRPRRRCSRS